MEKIAVKPAFKEFFDFEKKLIFKGKILQDIKESGYNYPRQGYFLVYSHCL